MLFLRWVGMIDSLILFASQKELILSLESEAIPIGG